MLDETILKDIFDNRRLFLPGEPCAAHEVRAHFDLNILIDGLTQEEAKLVLSTLPRNAQSIYLTPLDKGLSGSKVFSGWYELDGRPGSKLFVFKLGVLKKIDHEREAIESHVLPYIHGIMQPIVRRGDVLGLIVQELAGLGAQSALKSLKEHVRSSSDGAGSVRRLLTERLKNWYTVREPTTKTFALGNLFEWYLEKVTSADPMPAEWAELKTWVRRATGLKWTDVNAVADKLKHCEITSRNTIVHGDLHSQNVLVDERGEVWPIDFAWCHNDASPLLDFSMLECSLKFLALPLRSDLRTLIKLEHRLLLELLPEISVGSVPYRTEIMNVLNAVFAVREAVRGMGFTFSDYRKTLALMTYVHSTHPLLNRPLVLASLQMSCALEGELT